jgi:hypothetical protein
MSTPPERSPPSLAAKVAVALVVAVITAVVTLFAYRYYYSVCCSPPAKMQDV